MSTTAKTRIAFPKDKRFCKILLCQRCGKNFANGLLLNHRTKYLIKVIEMCPLCCRDAVIGLLRSRQTNWTWLEAFSRNFAPKK